MSVVLVVNSGSSSFKYQLLDMDREEVLASGLVERIGDPSTGSGTGGSAKHTVAAAVMVWVAVPPVPEPVEGSPMRSTRPDASTRSCAMSSNWYLNDDEPLLTTRTTLTGCPPGPGSR